MQTNEYIERLRHDPIGIGRGTQCGLYLLASMPTSVEMAAKYDKTLEKARSSPIFRYQDAYKYQDHDQLRQFQSAVGWFDPNQLSVALISEHIEQPVGALANVSNSLANVNGCFIQHITGFI